MSARINVRRIDFIFGNHLPKYWFGNNKLLTHTLNSLSLLFPEGERFFIRSVGKFKVLADANLGEEIRLFSAQEAQHGLAHNEFNDLLTAHGYDYKGFITEVESFIFGVFEPFITENIWSKFGLSVTAAAEHFTAAWAANFLANREDFKNTPKEIRELFLWHACEEIEHKSVAFNLLQKVDNSYTTRIAGMLVTFTFIPIVVGIVAQHFIRQDEKATISSLIKEAPELLLKDKSLGRLYISAFFQYLKPSFHPEQNDDIYLVHEHFAQTG